MINSKEKYQIALIKLLSQKPLEKISIASLSKEAGLHRGTFYKSYQDIYDLFEKIIQQFTEDFLEILLMPSEMESRIFFHELLHFFKERQEISKIIFKQNDANPFFKTLHQTMSFHYMDYYGEEMKLNFPYIMNYHMDGIISIIKNWVLDDFSEDIELIINLTTLLDNQFEKLVLGNTENTSNENSISTSN